MRILLSTLVSCGMLGLVAVAGCSDAPSLKVTVIHGTNSFVLTATTVDVYESETLRCDKLRFGKVTLDSIAPFKITDQNTGDVLEGLPRTGHIVVVAQGYVGETIAMIGCGEVDEIKAGDALEIATKPATLVSAQAAAENNGDLKVKVTITDIANQSLENVPVHWTLYGPGGATFTQGKLVDTASDDEAGVYLIDAIAACPSDDCSGGLGRVSKTFAHPSLSGPFAVRPRAEWALAPSAPLTQFAGKPLRLDTTVVLSDFDGARRVANPCTVFRPVNQPASLFCLQSQSGGQLGVVQYFVEGGRLKESSFVVSGFMLGVPPVAILSDADAVFLLARSGRWRKVFPSVESETAPWALNPLEIVAQAVYLPSCGETAARVVALTKTASSLAIGISTLGSASFTKIPITAAGVPPNLVLQNGGCVTNVGIPTPIAYQSLLAIALPSAAATSNPGAFMTFTPPVSGAPMFESVFQISRVPAAGYAVSVGAAGDQRILTAEVDITGAVIQESVLSTKTSNGGNNMPALLVRRTFPAVALPSQIRSGTFDSGTDVDLAWMIQQERTSLMQVLIDRPVGSDRLSALYSQDFVGTFDTGNFDSTGAADIISWGVGDLEVPGTPPTTVPVFRISVALMGVAF